MKARVRTAAAFVGMAALALLGVALRPHGGSSEAVVARVGASAITERALVERMSALAPGRPLPDPPRYASCIARRQALTETPVKALLEQECRQEHATLERQALDSLISSRWLVGEAAEEGMKLDAPAPAAQWLQRRLLQRQAAVGQGEVAAFYAQHLQRYERPERRYIEIVEGLGSQALAMRVLGEAQAGRSLASMAPDRRFHREALDRSELAHAATWQQAVVRAIFSARLHALVGPLPLRGLFCVFEVTRLAPGRRTPLAAVRTAIERQLARERRRRALAGFIAAWRSRWTARTSCRPGYVVQKCREYRGARAPEDPLAFS